MKRYHQTMPAPRRRRAVIAGIALACALVAVAAAVAFRGDGTRPPSHAIRGIDERGNLTTFRRAYEDVLTEGTGLVRRLAVPYVANGGARRTAYVVLPRWYGASKHPPIPLVISPHGRGVSAVANLRFWRQLPAYGPFALVSPDGQGRRLELYSWGWRGQIDDLARLPGILTAAVPWLRIDRSRIYAIGSSMGGQETLLLVARHPRLLAGAVALDSATDMAARYRAFPQLQGGSNLQALARDEIGGTPQTATRAYAERSPVAFAAAIARSGVPLQIWWSTHDRIVRNQNGESGRMYRMIRRSSPHARVTQYVGAWAHSKEFHDVARLPLALVKFRLIELSSEPPPGLFP